MRRNWRRVGFGAVAERFARGVGRLSRVLRIGAGTTVPGRVIDALDQDFVSRRAGALPSGIVVVSGTNGKTTTASMLQSILASEGMEVVANRSGANLASGVASAFLAAPHGAEIGVFEIDEAALPKLVPRLRPRMLVFTNVFRDQLDRFAEPERVAGMLREAADRAPQGCTIVANADDVQLWAALEDLHPIGFGVVGPPAEDAAGADAAGADAAGADAEPQLCPRCGVPLTFVRQTIAGLGAAKCRACHWRSGRPDHVASVVSLGGLEAQVLEIDGELVTLPMGGIHNAYNAAAAVAAASILGIKVFRSACALEEFEARFGRSEEFEFEGRTLWLALAKNPAGATALIDEIANDPRVGAVVVGINDKHADGRDISWIWDANFEALAGLPIPFVASGTRSRDTAVRLRYAGARTILTEDDPLLAIRAAVAGSAPDRVVVVLATYTAILATRTALIGHRSGRVEDVPA